MVKHYPAGRISLRDAVPAEPGKPGGKPSPTRPPSAQWHFLNG